MISKVISWKTHEHNRKEHSSDWFWAVGIVALGGVVLALRFGNYLFAILIALVAFTAILYAHANPQEITVKIDRKGIRIDNTLYPFTTLRAFWIEDVEQYGKDQLIVRSRKLLVPYIIAPIPESIDLLELQDFLLNFLREEEMEEPVSHKIMEGLGF